MTEAVEYFGHCCPSPLRAAGFVFSFVFLLLSLYSSVSSMPLAVCNIFYNLAILNLTLHTVDVSTSGERLFFLPENQMLESVTINII